MDSDIVKLEVSGHVALVTLNRPPVNALNRAMRDAIIETFDAVSEREDIRVAVLTGAGKAFCAGADLKDRPDPSKTSAFARGSDCASSSSSLAARVARTVDTMPPPLRAMSS